MLITLNRGKGMTLALLGKPGGSAGLVFFVKEMNLTLRNQPLVEGEDRPGFDVQLDAACGSAGMSALPHQNPVPIGLELDRFDPLLFKRVRFHPLAHRVRSSVRGFETRAGNSTSGRASAIAASKSLRLNAS
jgi:hypothetical protein